MAYLTICKFCLEGLCGECENDVDVVEPNADLLPELVGVGHCVCGHGDEEAVYVQRIRERLEGERKARIEGFKARAVGRTLAPRPGDPAHDEVCAFPGDPQDRPNAMREAEDLLRRLDEWDVMGVTHDGPYWRGEIARVRRALQAAYQKEQ